MKRFAILFLFFLSLGGVFAEPSFASDSTGEEISELDTRDQDAASSYLKKKFERIFGDKHLAKIAVGILLAGGLAGARDALRNLPFQACDIMCGMGVGITFFGMTGLLSWNVVPYISVLSWIGWFTVYDTLRGENTVRLMQGGLWLLRTVFWISAYAQNSQYLGTLLKKRLLGSSYDPVVLDGKVVGVFETYMMFFRSFGLGALAFVFDYQFEGLLPLPSILLVPIASEILPNKSDTALGICLDSFLPYLTYARLHDYLGFGMPNSGAGLVAASAILGMLGIMDSAARVILVSE